MLQKLINITKSREKKTIRSITPLPRTLNSINRKKEASRISEENKRSADRIANRSPVLNRKCFEKEFELHKKYKDLLGKNYPNPRRACSTKRLAEKLGNGIKTINESEEFILTEEKTLKNIKNQIL